MQYHDAITSNEQLAIVKKFDELANFLGYRIWPTHKLMRTQSVTGAKKKIRSYMRHGEKGKLQQFLSSWLGHAKWADSANLVRHLKEVELCLPS